MAQSSQQPEIAALIQRTEASRRSLGHHAVQIRQKLDVPSRFKQSFVSNPIAWFGSSLGLGYVASRLLRRPKREKNRRGWTTLLFGTLFTFLKPTLKGVITSEIQRRFMAHATRENPNPETRFPLSNHST